MFMLLWLEEQSPSTQQSHKEKGARIPRGCGFQKTVWKRNKVRGCLKSYVAHGCGVMEVV
jgi:hypothetical protein